MSCTAIPELRVLPREMRLQTERILLLTALPKGFVPQAVDAIILSQCMGLGGFPLLERCFDGLNNADPSRLRVVSEAAGRVRLDAGGEHGWIALPGALDLLAECVAEHGYGQVIVENAADADELSIATVFGERFGLAVVVEQQPDGSVVLGGMAAPRSADGLDRVFRAALGEGVPVESDLWWRLYRLSNSALSPDSPVSRRHAGPLIVHDDGRVFGRVDNDDDTDISFISATAEANTQRPETA